MQAPQQDQGVEPTEAELAEEAKNEQENAAKVEAAPDEALQSALKIAKAYPVAREKCEDNEKWQTFKTALGALSPEMCQDWEAKVEPDAFEANLTDLHYDGEKWEKIASLFAEAIKD